MAVDGMQRSAASCWHLHRPHRYGVARVVSWHVAILFARSCLNHLVLSEVQATLGITRIVYPGIIINTRGNQGSAILNTHIAYIMQVRCSWMLIQRGATHVGYTKPPFDGASKHAMSYTSSSVCEISSFFSPIDVDIPWCFQTTDFVYSSSGCASSHVRRQNHAKGLHARALLALWLKDWSNSLVVDVKIQPVVTR